MVCGLTRGPFSAIYPRTMNIRDKQMSLTRAEPLARPVGREVLLRGSVRTDESEP